MQTNRLELIFGAAFLRLSRAAVDDSISQSLSGLTLPAQGDADSVRTAQRIPTSQHINSESCRSFQNLVLFPSWKFRTSVLDYCAVVAASPDPNDPGRFLRAAEARERREHVIDERLDPYSARYFPRETRTQCLANLVRQERAIEEIVRHRTWSVMQDRCHSSRSSWQDAMKNFEDKYRGAIKARASVESGP